MMGTKRPNEKKKAKTKLSRRTMLIGAILLALLAFGVYELGRHAQKWGETNELRAMKAESLANTDLLGLKLVKAEQMGEGSLIGKTISPNVTRVFEAEDGDVEATKKQIIEYAESEGWVYDPTYQGKGSWRAHKTSGKFELTTIVSKPLRYDTSVKVVLF